MNTIKKIMKIILVCIYAPIGITGELLKDIANFLQEIKESIKSE